MTIRSYLSAKIKLVHAVVLSAAAVLILLSIILCYVPRVWTVIIFLLVLFFMVIAAIFFGPQIRCPMCGNRVLRTTRHGGFWGLSKDIKYCAFCGADFDQEMPATIEEDEDECED